MPGKTLKTRIQNKVDSLANLQANNPYILAGELVTAYTTVGVKQEDGNVVQKRVAYIYVGPGNFNDLYPIVGPSADVKAWAKVDNFVDVVIEKLTKTDEKGDIAENDTVNTMINRINNNFAQIKTDIPSKTSDLTNDGEGAEVPIKDFITGYESYQFVSRDSVKNYINTFGLQDLEEIKKKLTELEKKVDDNLKAIDERFKLYYTKTEINDLLAGYLKGVQIGDKDGGVVLSPASTVVTSEQLWTQVKDASQKDIEKIADAAASTALSQAKTYTDTKLSEFITISYKGPYDSYAALLANNINGGKAGIIYLVNHNHNDNDSYDSTDSDIFDEYIWVTRQDGGQPGFEKVGNTDVKLSNYLQAVLKEDKTGVLEGDEGSVSKIEIVEEPVGSGNKVFKVTYKTLIKSETFDAGKVAVGFGNGALKSSALVNIPLTGIAAGSAESDINETTTLGGAIRNLETKIADAKADGVKEVDIATDGGVDVSGGPITNKGTLKVSHSLRATATSAVSDTVGSADERTYVKEIALDKYGHIVSVTTGKETNVDNYATGGSFTADNTKIELTVTGTGPNFKTFKAGLNKLPAMLLSQTDAEDDFLVLYCGTSSILASTEQVNYT